MANRRGKKPFGGARGPRARPAEVASRSRDSQQTHQPGLTANGFSMRDEARNTASHHSAWAQNAMLRQRPVAFVSAGFVEPLRNLKLPETSTQDKMADNDADPAVESRRDSPGFDIAEELEMQAASPLEAKLEIREESLRYDASSSGKLSRDSDSGLRNQSGGPNSPGAFFFDLSGDKSLSHTRRVEVEVQSPRSPSGESNSSDEIILFKGRAGYSQGFSQSSSRPGPPRKQPEAIVETHRGTAPHRHRSSDGDTGRSSRPRQKSSGSSHNRPRTTDLSSDDDEDEILADYIANMAANPEDDFITHQLQSFSTQRELGGQDGAFDFGSTSREQLADLGNSSSGGEGEMTESDDDSINELRKVANLSESEAEEGEEELDSGADDEVIAQLLAKQEELGLGSDKLLLFSGSYTKSGGGKRSAKSLVMSTNRSTKQNSSNTNTNSVTEAFDDLDLAGWDPSNLLGQRKGRRRKQPPAFNAPDSEVETALKTAWERDRERKKNRKMEREALRASGLLGKNANPDDLRVKYREGMTLEEMKKELLGFLISTAETVQFPPMDKQARKILHELANQFKIKSQSTGSSDQRRPVLYRTKRTVRYSETRFEEAAGHVENAAIWIRRKYFHRIDVKGGKPSVRNPGPGGQSGSKVVNYRDGEIAGASVPELGQENKGRAMLEKMGWAKGMALGTGENQGILEPVAQVVKRSKAGLG